MKARIGYIEKTPEDGELPRFKKYLDRYDRESMWIQIVYWEVETE